MSSIWLKNTTGNRAGHLVRVEMGEDLFGFLFYDVYSGRKHNVRKLKTRIFSDPAAFIRSLDVELYNKENRDYVPIAAGL
ncbi:MAG: hypothetical protein CMN76_05870 [Spirochaetaceae bacterium]|nr:hypothetical protein [Spirochaetaceae bacterium]|tara:strand:- start:203893 stop:204132 length:240 start_codon:yes stop_codon:yes gene_type:complete